MSERLVKTTDYYPTPTIKEFHANDSQVRGVLGPVGSGKSVGMIGELMMRAMAQEPDGVGMRRTKWGVFRKTYPSLISTTIATWREWAPQARVTMGRDIHWHWEQKRALPDGTGVDMEVVFIAIEDPRTDIDKLRSLDLTGAWCNEASEIDDFGLIKWMLTRCGRFPRALDAPLTWSGLIMDSNAMNTDHWWYEVASEVTPIGWRFWKQPPALIRVDKGTAGSAEDGQGQSWALNPLCENVQGQPKKERYWLDLVPGNSTAWISLNLCAHYGPTQSGKPVFSEFDPDRHIAKAPLEPLANIPLQIGYDTGLTPTFIIGQITDSGQLRVIAECGLTNMGMRQAVRDALKPMLSNKFAGWPVFAVGDPAGRRRNDSDESTAMEEIVAQGIEVKEAPTNLFSPRRDAVASFMLKRTRNVITGESEEGFVISPTCKMLVKGLRAGYVYGRMLVNGQGVWKDEPVKNEFSHYCDALQYIAVLYDRPRLAQQEMNRRLGDKPIEIGFDSNYPTI